jgi:predicted ThiF/HesA family dinucleotide-utilizing enzyme
MVSAMKVKFVSGLVVLVSFFGVLPGAHAVQTVTQFAKVAVLQGHYVPGCRVMVVRENSSTLQKAFRIREVTGGQDNIAAIALAAMISNRDVKVYYDSAVTGCGSEPLVDVIEIY